MKFFEVFKAGKYPQGKFTKKEIAEIAKNYDPKFCEAPITIDHQQSGPAYGWVDTVKAEGDKLKVAVKGLEPIKFMESESDTYEFEAEDVEDDEAQTFSEADIEDLKNQIAVLEDQVSKFKENNKKMETIKSLKEKISALTDEVATFKEKAQGKEEIEKELHEIKIAIKKREFDEFIDKQIDKGTLVPANKEVVLSVLQELDNVQKFGEDSTVINDFKTFIESLPPQIEFDEIASKKKQDSKSGKEVEKFANADEDSLEIFKEAKALAEKENISFRDALLKLDI